MDMSKNGLFWKVIGITIIISLVIIFSWGIVTERQLANDHRFTIATTTGRSSGDWVDYEFTVNGVTYNGSHRTLTMKQRGGRYFVKYYPLDPSVISKIVSNEEVLDCVGEPPPDGWAEIPKCK